MVAPIEVCRICNCDLPKKHRRVIFSESFCVFNQLTQVIDNNASPNDGMSKYVCGYCLTKLNKLHKIDMKLVHKMDALRREKGGGFGDSEVEIHKSCANKYSENPKVTRQEKHSTCTLTNTKEDKENTVFNPIEEETH